MILEFLPGALDAYKTLKSSNPSLTSKVKAIIKDALEHPATGIGEPVQLAGAYRGIWMRRLSATDEMYYVFDDTKMIVISFSFTGTSHSGAKAYELILEEFNLPKEKTSAKYAVHWDIGMSWR